MSPILASCLKKRAYTESEARQKVETSTEPGLVAYRCPLGTHWHCGHKRSKKRKQR